MTDARAQESFGWWEIFDEGETVWLTWAHAISGRTRRTGGPKAMWTTGPGIAEDAAVMRGLGTGLARQLAAAAAAVAGAGAAGADGAAETVLPLASRESVR